jgi:hypothetical protein
MQATVVTVFPAFSVEKKNRDRSSIDIAMQYLFDCLSRYVKASPEQWEGWRYLHRFAIHSADNNVSQEKITSCSFDTWRVNSSRYFILKAKSQHLLFDKSTYRLYPLSEKTYT